MKYINKIPIRWVSHLCILLAVTSATAQTVHISHCLNGCPVGEAENNVTVVHHLFAASINHQSGLADWVAYRVLAGTIGIASLLPRLWAADNLVVPDSTSVQLLNGGPGFAQLDLSDQQDRNYRVNEITIKPEDRGRLVPLSSFADTPYWPELNYLSNMAPLPSDLRTGSWSRLDQSINELARRVGEVFVISGPLYKIQPAVNTRTGNSFSRPAAFFKVVATESALVGFIFPWNLNQHVHYCDLRSSLQRVERRSGLNLFPNRQDSTALNLPAALGCPGQ